MKDVIDAELDNLLLKLQGLTGFQKDVAGQDLDNEDYISKLNRGIIGDLVRAHYNNGVMPIQIDLGREYTLGELKNEIGRDLVNGCAIFDSKDNCVQLYIRKPFGEKIRLLGALGILAPFSNPIESRTDYHEESSRKRLKKGQKRRYYLIC